MYFYELFEYYPVPAGQVKSAADATRNRASAIKRLADQVEADHRQAVAAVAGTLRDTIANAPTEAITTASAVQQEAEFAAGCLELFSLGIDNFNYDSTSPRSVARLNSAYTAAADNSFGATYHDPGATATQQEREQANDAYTTAFSAARAALIRELTAEYNRLDGNLDDRATEIAAMLDRGPNLSDVQSMWRAGALPPYAMIVYPSYGLDDIAMPESAQREFVDYLLAHPDQFTNAAYTTFLLGLGEAQRSRLVDGFVTTLQDAGRLEGDPPDLYREWIWWTMLSGVPPAEMVRRAEQEGVTAETFKVLDGLDIFRTPEGRPYFLLDDDEGAKEIARAAELINGRQPSYSEARRDANNWTYDGPLWQQSDVSLVLDNGGAIVATPEGILMTAAGDSDLGLPNLIDLFSVRGGVTWGEMFVTNGSHDDPAAVLRAAVTQDTLNGVPLGPLLGHERIHSEQWAYYGYYRFIYEYIREGFDPCENRFEQEAGWEEGGYPCD